MSMYCTREHFAEDENKWRENEVESNDQSNLQEEIQKSLICQKPDSSSVYNSRAQGIESD